MPSRPLTQPVAGPAAGWRRLVRAAALAIPAYALAVGAHTGAGGRWPGWAATMVLTGLLGLVSLLLTARRRGLPSLLAVLTTVQAGLHLLFSRLGEPTVACTVTAAGHHQMVASCSSDSMAAASAGPASSGMNMPTVWMTVAHVVATVLTAWLLSRGEAWLWRTIDRIFAPSAPIAIQTPAPRVTGHQGTTPVLLRVRMRPDAPRGPPRLRWTR